MERTRELTLTFTLNEDGTFKVSSEFGTHYGNATLGEAVGHVADELLDIQNGVA